VDAPQLAVAALWLGAITFLMSGLAHITSTSRGLAHPSAVGGCHDRNLSDRRCFPTVINGVLRGATMLREVKWRGFDDRYRYLIHLEIPVWATFDWLKTILWQGIAAIGAKKVIATTP
jgi:hypothetical protein